MRETAYIGHETNLGRFGLVRKGDKLLLTDAEHHAIESDNRFEEWDEKKHGKMLAPVPAPKADAPADEKEEALQAKNAEEARRSTLEKANDEWGTMKLELEQSTFVQLEAVAKEMNEEHESGILYTKKTSKTELIRLIIEAKKRLAEKGTK